jgi:N-terminal domain of (some) glycogen debranching enzymes
MARKPAPEPEPIRYVDPVVRPIVQATDLGSVQVLKQGDLDLLTDPFGDIDPDSRGLGLYLGDTRRPSCEILRVNGLRPVLLQASAGGNWRGTIQMTNPRLDRNLRDKLHPEDSLPSRKPGIARTRTLTGEQLDKRVRVVNHAGTDEEVALELDRSVDDLRLLMNDRPRPGERDVAAGVPRFTTLFGGDAIITALQVLAVRPQLAVETPPGLDVTIRM